MLDPAIVAWTMPSLRLSVPALALAAGWSRWVGAISAPGSLLISSPGALAAFAAAVVAILWTVLTKARRRAQVRRRGPLE